MIKIRLAIFVLVCTQVVVPACSMRGPDCGEDSDAVRYARSLSEDRIAKLFRDVQAQIKSGEVLNRVGPRTGNGPEWMSDLKYHDIIVNPGRSRIMLQGCFDHYVILQVQGAGEPRENEPSTVLLMWGEGPDAGKEELWRK